MGQAKNRGTFAQRQDAAIKRDEQLAVEREARAAARRAEKARERSNGGGMSVSSPRLGPLTGSSGFGPLPRSRSLSTLAIAAVLLAGTS